MAKKGPGRPFKPKPGPQLEITPHMHLSDAVTLDILKELLSPEAFDDFLTLPRKNHRLFIDQFKKTIFTLTGRVNADPNLVLLGEYGDMRGVGVTFDLQEFAKDPLGYVRTLPKAYISGIFNASDLEREIELRVIKEVATKGSTIKKAFPLNGENGVNTLQLVQTADPTKGKDDIKSLKNFNKDLNNWADTVPLLLFRQGNTDKIIDDGNYLLAEELVYGATPGKKRFVKSALVNGERKLVEIDDDSDIYLDKFRDKLDQAPEEVQDLFKNFREKKGYQEAISKNIRGVSGATARDILGLNIRGDNALEAAKTLDAFLDGSTPTPRSVMENLREKVINNPKNFGFTSMDAFDALMGRYSGVKTGNLLTAKDGVSSRLTPITEDYTNRDVYAFSQILLELKNSATSAKQEIRDSIEQEYRFNHKRFNNLIAQFATPNQDLQREIAQRLGGVEDWKEYVRIRSLMEDQEDFIKNLSKGQIWQAYFYLGRYNDFVYKHFPWFQETHQKILNIRVPGTSKRLVDFQNRIVQFRDGVAERLGFAGNPIPTRGLLGLAQKNVSYLYMSEFDPRITSQKDMKVKWILNGRERKFKIFQQASTHSNLQNQAEEFSNKLFNFKAPIITAFAEDFKSMPDVLKAMEFMAAHNNVDTIEALRNLFNATRTSGDIRGFLKANGIKPEHLNAYTQAFESIFSVLDGYKLKGLDENQFFDFVLLMQKKFMVNGVLNEYLPFLNSVAVRLSNVQTYLYRIGIDKIAAKVADSTNIFARATVWWYKNFYNPRFGALERAKNIVAWFESSRVGVIWSKISSSVLGKVFGKVWSVVAQSAFSNVGSFTAWLALVIARTSLASLKSMYFLVRGKFKEILAEWDHLWDDLVVKPLGMFVKLIFWGIVLLIALVYGLVTILVGGVLEQTSARDIAEGLKFTDYSQEVPINLTGSKACVEGSGYGADGDILKGVLKNPVPPAISYAAGQCPGFSPGSARDNFHAGLDYSVTVGSQVKFPFDSNVCGKVTYSNDGWNDGYGGLVIVETEVDGEKFYLYFGHLSDTTVVRDLVGKKCGISGGDTLALSGNTGNSTGPHLHFEIRDSSGSFNKVINPCSILQCPDECYSGSFTDACTDTRLYK